MARCSERPSRNMFLITRHGPWGENTDEPATGSRSSRLIRKAGLPEILDLGRTDNARDDAGAFGGAPVRVTCEDLRLAEANTGLGQKRSSRVDIPIGVAS